MKTPEQDSKVVLRVKELTKSFGRKHIIENVNLEINENDIFGIIGMSGTGKTTLLRLLCGFIKPSHGNVMFKRSVKDKKEGIYKTIYSSVYNKTNLFKKRYGFSTQEPSFYDYLTVRENLLYFGSLYNLRTRKIEKNIRALLRLVGLEKQEDTLAVNLSGGEQKRLDIACALVHEPHILFLDEPTADLDPLLRKQLWKLIKKINQNNTTIIIASHFLDEIETLCTKIALLHKKRIVGYGSLKELQELFSKNEEIHATTTPGNQDAIIANLKKKGYLGIKKIIKKKDKIIFYVPNAQKIVSKLIKIFEEENEKIEELELCKSSLNEIFEELVVKNINSGKG